MPKKCFALFAALILMFTLAGCEPKPESFPGQATIPYDVGDKFIVNITDDSKKYISCAVTLDVSSEDDVKVLTEKNHWVRDTVIAVIRTKTDAQLEAADAMEVVGQEIGERITQEFQLSGVFRVSFKEYYVYSK